MVNTHTRDRVISEAEPFIDISSIVCLGENLQLLFQEIAP